MQDMNPLIWIYAENPQTRISLKQAKQTFEWPHMWCRFRVLCCRVLNRAITSSLWFGKSLSNRGIPCLKNSSINCLAYWWVNKNKTSKESCQKCPSCLILNRSEFCVFSEVPEQRFFSQSSVEGVIIALKSLKTCCEKKCGLELFLILFKSCLCKNIYSVLY